MQDAILIALLSWKTKSINCDAIYNILTSWMTLILAYRYNYLFKQQNMQMKAKHTTEWLDLAKDYSLAGLFERLYSACYWRRSVHSVTSNWHNRQHLTRWITRHWSSVPGLFSALMVLLLIGLGRSLLSVASSLPSALNDQRLLYASQACLRALSSAL